MELYNPFEDLILLDNRIYKLAERSNIINNRSEKVERGKYELQSHINSIDESVFSDEEIEKYNTLTRQSFDLVQKRKELAEGWKKLKNERNEINEFSERMLKYYKDLSDGAETSKIMNEQIEQKLSQFQQVLTKQEEILSNRENILEKEEQIVSQSRQLLGLKI
ncbi:MAG TPA: hypothetical protein DHV48_06970 [Prolixibacteraceae bacterium]|nr:hypothetical protein [Prolixibacteraceae bacterium]